MQVTQSRSYVECSDGNYVESVQRVAVVGSGGAGKSTFARTLSRVTELPVVHLDEHYWHPGWVETPRDEWALAQRSLVAQERWIIEGNYSNTFDIRFARADTVIVLAFARRVCIYRALKRVALNWHRETQALGCPEHFDVTFLRWLWEFPYNGRPKLDAALQQFGGHLCIVELRTPAAARKYLFGLAKHR
jgi:adenylate kinase family enzyme